MSAQPGDVDLAGTMAGPEQQFPLSEGALAQACEAAGLPRGLWQLVSDGGRLTIEPSVERLPASHAQQVPGASVADATAQALRSLTQGRPLPEDWASTLRLTQYGEGSKTEYLLAFGDDGLRLVGRESPWVGVPEAGVWQRLRPYALPIVLLSAAVLGTLWLNRAELLESWRQTTEPATTTSEDELN